MGYPQELLSDGEMVEFEMHPHWRALIFPIFVTLAVIAGLAFIMAKWSDWFSDIEVVDSVGRWVFLGVAIFLLALYAIRPFLYWITTQYVFTDQAHHHPLRACRPAGTGHAAVEGEQRVLRRQRDRPDPQLRHADDRLGER